MKFQAVQTSQAQSLLVLSSPFASPSFESQEQACTFAEPPYEDPGRELERLVSLLDGNTCARRMGCLEEPRWMVSMMVSLSLPLTRRCRESHGGSLRGYKDPHHDGDMPGGALRVDGWLVVRT